MATKNGTNSRNGSKYTFYLDYSVTADPSNYRWKITARAKLTTKGWAFSTSSSHSCTVKIDGTSYTKNHSGLSVNANGTTKTINLSDSETKYIPFSSSSKSITLSASTNDINSGGYGPGKCSVSVSVTLGAKYSSAGKLSVGSLTEKSGVVKLAELPKSVGYPRTIDWSYKLGAASSYTKAGSTNISSSSTTTSFSKTISGLTGGKAYNFRAIVKAGNGTTLATKTVTGTTKSDSFDGSLSIGKTTATIKASYTATSATDRKIRTSYKKASESSYALWSTTNITANSKSMNINITKLNYGTDYNFKIELLSGTTVLKTLTLNGKTQDKTADDFPEILFNEVRVTNKSVYIDWEVAEHIAGHTYSLYYELTGGNVKKRTVNFSTPPTSPAVIDILELPSGNVFSVKIGGHAIDSSNRKVEYVYDDDLTIYRSFAWSTNISANSEAQVLSGDWNLLIDLIAEVAGEVLEYVDEGDILTAEHYNEVANILGVVPVSSEQKLTASKLNLLSASLNSLL